MLLEIKRILKPGGTLIVGVPNSNSLLSKICKDYNDWQEVWQLPLHLYFYSKKTLEEVIRGSGFNIFYSGKHSAGSIRVVLENFAVIKFILKTKFLRLIWNGLFIFIDFFAKITPWADGLEVHCKK